MQPKIRCPSGTNVKKGDSLDCNIYASNVKLDRDINVTFTLESGSGLAFSASQGCTNVKGSQCIGTYQVASLSDEGISVELNALAPGNSMITGVVNYQYGGKSVTEPVTTDFDHIHVYYCGDGVVDPGETKTNCCQDVGVSFSPYSLINEQCRDNQLVTIVNYSLIWAVVVLVGIALVVFVVAKKFIVG
jgi:hypothetical protein